MDVKKGKLTLAGLAALILLLVCELCLNLI